MKSRNLYCFSFIAVNLLALVVSLNQQFFSNDKPQRRLLAQEEPAPSYQFDDPEAAYQILKKLDVFIPVETDLTEVQIKRKFSGPLIGQKPDFEYCDKHKALLANNTDFIFKEKNFLTSYTPLASLRKNVIPAIGGNDYTPRGVSSDSINDVLNDMRLDITTFFIFGAFTRRQIGKQFSCTTQISNHIPGHDNLYRKDSVGEALVKYTSTYESRPQCFNSHKFFPQTWSMKIEEQCKAFFEEFNSFEYQKMKNERGVVYFRKKGFGAHGGRGVFPVDSKEEIYIRELYKNGNLCGKVSDNNIMQYFIHNPLLIDGRKSDFRIPMLIASTNPTMVYYHDGFLRVSMADFDPEAAEKASLLTNLGPVEYMFALAKENGTYNGKTEQELRDSAVWSYDRLQTYLLEKGLTQDPNWLNNYFRPELKKLIIHLVRMTQDPFAKRSSLFEIFGLDIILDADLNLWFIEANANLGLEGSSDHAKALFRSFLADTFEILYGLLRSRTKRMVNYVNYLTKTAQAYKINGGEDVYIEDLQEKRLEFQELIKNYFEPEFKPSPTNGFSKIIDDSLSGVERYSYLIDKECL